MNSNVKSAGVAHADAAAGFYRVAIVGAGSLKGKEVAEVLEQRNFPSSEIKLLDDDEALGQLEALKDEVTFIQSIRSEQFDHVDFTFFASDAECTRKNWKQVMTAGSAIVDLSYALEDEAGATVRAPWIERQLSRTITPELQPAPVVTAHPISVVLALLLLRINTVAPLRRAVATVFEPASEHGQKGMDELHEQTVNLLSFQQLPKNIFDVQVAFNLVARYGENSPSKLSSVSERIVKHFRAITEGQVPVPSMQILQAPIFHGHAVSLNVQFDGVADLAQISHALVGEHVSLIGTTEEAPSNVNAAGQSDMLVSVTPDAADTNSIWIWATSDNLRVAAATAVEAAESMAATRPKGKIQ
ncbi:MAG TPA: Asd/ArgC dimerization domain-containing protein [Terriglobales bacterium]|nr:Asd/ArgC dimerization domain-containing protein [Terriglobales bacterium]